MSVHSTMTQSYNAHSSVQHETALSCIQRLLPVGLSSVDQYNNGAAVLKDNICIVDYGCAGAKNAVQHIDQIVAQLAAHKPSKPSKSNQDKADNEKKHSASREDSPIRSITVVYNDQPENEWQLAVDTITSHEPTASITPYPYRMHALLSPHSFFQQVCAKESVDLGFSNQAMHWLSATPCPLQGHVLSYFRHNELNNQDVRAWREQARHDWLTLLTHRYRELKQGGLLLISMLGRGSDDADPMIKESEKMFRAFQRFVDEGLLSEQQLSQHANGSYARTVEEVLEPIEKGSNGIQFRLLNPDDMLAYSEHPVYRSYRDVHHDAKRYAKELIAFFRPVHSRQLLHTCNGNLAQSEAIWQRWEELVASDVDGYGFCNRFYMIELLLHKL